MKATLYGKSRLCIYFLYLLLNLLLFIKINVFVYDAFVTHLLFADNIVFGVNIQDLINIVVNTTSYYYFSSVKWKIANIAICFTNKQMDKYQWFIKMELEVSALQKGLDWMCRTPNHILNIHKFIVLTTSLQFHASSSKGVQQKWNLIHFLSLY